MTQASPLWKRPILYILVLLIFMLILLTTLQQSKANRDSILDSETTTVAELSQSKQLKKQIYSRAKETQVQLEENMEQLRSQLSVKAAELKETIVEAPKTYPLEKTSYSTTQTYSYKQHIRPILNKKCLACHACYDAPCQLKMETAEALQRGASTIDVYDGSRLSEIPPTRLGIDAQTVEEWRKLGFFPIISAYNGNKEKPNTALMQKMLDLGHNNPLPANTPIPEQIDIGFSRVNTCPSPKQFKQYSESHPNEGMPLAVTGLTNKEYQTLSTWLTEGAQIENKPPTLSRKELKLIHQWEKWLNRENTETKLVSRYLYEHLFLAHLYLNIASTRSAPTFFKLIRSLNPPGKPAIPVQATRPNDAIDKPFFYRLQAITGTIVHKTHIIYPFGKNRIDEYQQLFFKEAWTAKKLPGYSEKEKTNPFITFAEIPAKTRYQFLLNDPVFFIRNFIRGPVCRGQIATDVIRDQFWIMFENPSDERYTNNEKYRHKVNSLLSVPGLNSKLSKLGSEWLEHKTMRNNYIHIRQKEYAHHFPKGAELSHIWNGQHKNTGAFQTIFRHHDSASVEQGWHGDIPITSWLIDYPLLERTIYELVVGFNVFGNVSHQIQTRLYFDLIRNEGEVNFLRLLPAHSRNAIYQHWYQGAGKVAAMLNYHELDAQTASNIPFQSTKPYSELLELIMEKHPEQTQRNDVINRCYKNCQIKSSDTPIETINKKLQALASTPAKNLPLVSWLPEISFLSIKMLNGEKLVYTLLRNRIHSNVAFLLGESLRYQKELDSLTIMPTLVGSYPNLIFHVEHAQLDIFIKDMAAVESAKHFEKVIEQWGARRMNTDFWEHFHSFKHYMVKHKPLEAGVYDLNRYGNH